jgi:hypothetical protein
MTDATLLQADYKLKIDYLTSHLGRMWTRFNFFLTIESALFGYSLGRDNAIYVPLLLIFGFFMSLLWYYFAAADNFLVEVYRRQVAHVFFLLTPSRDAAFAAEGVVQSPATYSYVGNTDKKCFDPKSKLIKKIKKTFWQRRSKPVSITELGVVFAVFFTVLWVARAIVWFVQSSGEGHVLPLAV